MLAYRPIAAAFVAAAVFSGQAFAQSAAIGGGRAKAVACQACHGMDGLSRLPDAPHLAGQPIVYLERALREYRSGARRNEVMSIAAKNLSDQDIRDLAAYYGEMQIEVKPR